MDEIDPVKFIGSSEQRLFEDERLMEAHISHATSNNLLISPTLWGLYFTLDTTLRNQCLTKLLEKTHEDVKNKYKAVIQDEPMLWGKTYDELGIVNVCGKVDPQFIKKFAAVKQTMILTAKRQQRESRRVMQAPDIDDPYAFIERAPSPLKWVPRPTFKCLETDKNVFHPDFEQAMSNRRPPKRMYDSNRSSEQIQWFYKLESTLAKFKMTHISSPNQNSKEKFKPPKNTDTNTDSGEENSRDLGHIKRTDELRIMEETPTCSKIADGAMANPTTKHKVTVKNTDTIMANNAENTRVINLISRKQKLAQQIEQELQDVKKLKKVRKTNKKSLDETIQKMRQDLDKKKSAGQKQEQLGVPKTPKQGNEGMTKKPGQEGTTKKTDNDVHEMKNTLKDKIQQMKNDLKRKKSIEQEALGNTPDLGVTKTRVHGKEDHIETKFMKHIVLDENNPLVDFDTLVNKRSNNTTHNTMTQVSEKTKSKNKKKKLFTQTSDNDLSPNIKVKGRTVSVGKIHPKTLGIGEIANKMEPSTDKPQRKTMANDTSVTKPDPKRMDINNEIETQPELEEMEIEELGGLSELKRLDTDTLALKSEDDTLKTKTYVGKTESKTQTMETEIKNHKYNQTKNAETENKLHAETKDNKKEQKKQDRKKNKESTRENKVKGNANNKNYDKPRELKQNAHNKAEALRVLEEHSIKLALDTSQDTVQHIWKQDDIELDKQEKFQTGQKTKNVGIDGEKVQQNISKKAEENPKQYNTMKYDLTNDKNVKMTVEPKLIQSSDDDDVGSPHKNESTVQDNRFDSHYKTVNKSDEKGGYNKLKLLELEEEPYNMEMINKELDELENCEFNTKQTVPESQDETTNEEDEHFFKFESKEHFVPQKIVRKEDSTPKMEDSDHEVPRENVNTPTQNIKKPTNTSLERPQTEVISQVQNDTFRRDVPENGSASGSFNTKTTRKLHQVPTNEEIPNHSKMNPANQIRQEIPNSDTSELSWMNEVLKVIPTPQTSTDDFVPNKSRYGSSEEEINKLANLMNGMTHDDNNNNETNSSIFQDEKKKNFKENKITGIKHDYHARSSRPISEDDNDNDTDFRSVFENKNTKNKIRPIISFNSQETSTQGIQSLDDSSYNKTQLQVAIQMTKEGKTNRKSQDTGELQYVLEHLSVNPAINKTDDTHMEIDQMSQLTSQQKEIQTEMTAQTMKNILKSTVIDMNIFDMTTPTLSKDYIPLNRQENQMKTPRNVENQDIEGTSKSAPSTSKSSMRKKRKTNSYPPLKLKGQNVSRPQLHSNKPSPQLPSNVQKQKYSSNGEKNPNQKSKESTTLLENITKITSQLNVSKKEHSNMMKALEEISLAPTAWSQSFKPPSNTREILNDLSTEDENTSKEMEICEMISSKGFKSNQELSKVKELTRTTVSSKEELSKITGSSNRTTHVINDPDFEPNHSISITSPEASISSLDLETELYLSQQISSDTHATKDKPAQFKSEQFKEIQFEDSPPEANVEEDNKTKIGKLAELMSIINDVVQYSDESTKNDTQLSVMQTSKLDSPWKINEENKALAVKTQIADLFNQPENSQSSSNSNEFLLSLMMNKEDSLLSSSDIETRSTFRHNFDLSEESTVDQEISHRSNRSVSQRLVTASPYPKKLRAILHTDESETSSQGQSQKLSRRQKYKANKLKSHMDNSNMNSQASTTGEHYDTDNKLNIDAISKKQQNSQSSTRNSQVSVGGRWTQTVDNILLNIKKKK